MEKWHYKLITYNLLGFATTLADAEGIVRLLTAVANLGVVSYSLYVFWKKGKPVNPAEKIESEQTQNEHKQ